MPDIKGLKSVFLGAVVIIPVPLPTPGPTPSPVPVPVPAPEPPPVPVPSPTPVPAPVPSPVPSPVPVVSLPCVSASFRTSSEDCRSFSSCSSAASLVACSASLAPTSAPVSF